MNKVDLISRIKLVPWHTFEMAELSDHDIAKSLIAIAEDNSAEENLTASDQIEDAVVRQGDLFEAAFYTVPFLVAIIHLGSPRATLCCLHLLMRIAKGWAALGRTIRTCEILSVGLDAVPLNVACRFALAAGIPAYVAVLNRADNPSNRLLKNPAF